MLEERVLKDRRDKFVSLYSPDTLNIDVIVGYRADDGFFNHILRFLRGYYYVGDMFEIMRSGFLGMQVAFKSERAIKRLKEVYKEESPQKYKGKYHIRVANASREIQNMTFGGFNNLVITDILRGGIDEV